MTTKRVGGHAAQTHRRWAWRLGGAGLAACIGLTALIGKQAEQAQPAAAQETGIGGTTVNVGSTATTDAGQEVDFVCTKPTCVIVFADPNGQIAQVPVAASGQVAAPAVAARTRASR